MELVIHKHFLLAGLHFLAPQSLQFVKAATCSTMLVFQLFKVVGPLHEVAVNGVGLSGDLLREIFLFF